jgi:hypothetical protein
MSDYYKYLKYKNKYLELLKNNNNQLVMHQIMKGGLEEQDAKLSNCKKNLIEYKKQLIKLNNVTIDNELTTDNELIIDNELTTDNEVTKDNYIICLLWYNKELGPISRDSKDGNNIFDIIKTYKMFKDYGNNHVVLFLNFNKITEEDFDLFSSNNITLEDVNEFNVIKTNKQLKQLFGLEKHI